jgi:hypothetical protein
VINTDPWPIFLVTVVVGFLVLEAWQGWHRRPTLSLRVRQWSQGLIELAYILCFAGGMVAGHWFWCWCGLRSP